MKGIVFNLLETCVTREHGPETWDALLETSGLDGAYTSLGNYADSDLSAIVAAASDALAQPPDAIVRWFGVNALPLFAERYPEFFAPHTTTRAFVLTVNDMVHPEVRKLYPGADVPTFSFADSTDELLVMRYRSDRRLCAFAEGLLHGAADHYDERIAIEQPLCMLRGDDHCVLEIATR